MKYKLKNKNILTNIILCLILIISIVLAFASTFYMKSLATDTKLNSTSVIKTDKNIVRSSKIDNYISSLENESLVEEINIKKEITSVLTIKDNKYQSEIFNYETGEELSIDDLLKEDKKEEFWNKITELAYLKYPNFIADVISKNDRENVYFLKDNELIIYYYDYEITPSLNEDIFLTVNYNEIKDYLNINVDLDSFYNNEDGSVINTNKKLVAITFDDGPGPYTNKLLDILNANKAHATFFMLGNNLEKYRSVVLNVYNSGNEIGYHSYAHTNFKRQDIATIKSELDQSNAILKNITGTTFNLIRPPYGSLNSEIKEELDASFILWSVDTEDWRHKDSEYLLNYVLENIYAGAIILFHDIHTSSVDAMAKILPYLYVEGYQVVTVSDLAKNYNVTLEPHKVYRYFK